MFSIAKTAVVVAATLVMASCDDLGGFSDSQRFKEDFHYSYDLKPGGTLYMENMNGSIEISGWEKDGIDISGTKYAAEENALEGYQGGCGGGRGFGSYSHHRTFRVPGQPGRALYHPRSAAHAAG
jgi:hypothetical protein